MTVSLRDISSLSCLPIQALTLKVTFKVTGTIMLHQTQYKWQLENHMHNGTYHTNTTLLLIQ